MLAMVNTVRRRLRQQFFSTSGRYRTYFRITRGVLRGESQEPGVRSQKNRPLRRKRASRGRGSVKVELRP